MPEATNTITNTLGLVKPPQIISQIFPQPIYPEVGFGLELFRNGIHIGSLYPGQIQPLSTKKGDTLYRINLGPHIYSLSGKLRTSEGYTREYSIQVKFQVQAPPRFLDLYRQGRDPVYQAILDIQAVIQEYADRTTYEHMQPANIAAKATYAFAKEPDNLKAGLRILGVHEPILGDDPAYQPIDLHPVIAINGQLTTREGYVRNYSLIAELLVHDSQVYREAEARGNAPLERAKDAINHALQLYARQNYYEDLLAPQLHNIVGHAFNDLSNQYIGGLKIINIHNLSLGVDKNYEPINLSPIISTRGRLTTREDYVRSYELTVELQVTNYQLYRYLRYTDAQNTSLDRTIIAIEGKLQEYARQQFYEDLTDSRLRPVIAQSFDGLENRISECLAIVRVHQLTLGEDTTYQATDLSPLLTISDQLTTRENHVCPYELIVELHITDRWLYLQLTREGAEPLHLAKITIEGELQKYARQQFYEDLSETQLLTVVTHAFDDLSNRITGGLEIVRPHRFSLGADATYQPLNLSPLLTLAGTVTTQEGYVRAYDLIIELLINDRRAYQQLIYEGTNPLEHVKVAINGELQKYVRQQFYEDLSEAQLTVVIERSFDTLASRVVGDIAIVGVHHFSLEADEHYQPINLSPLLTIFGQVITLEDYECDYEFSVELLIKELRSYQELIHEDIVPLDYAAMAIKSEFQKYARQHTYEGLRKDLSEAQLHTIVEQAFNTLSSRVTSTMEIVRAYQLSLKEPVDYIHLGPRTLTVSGKLKTTDFLERTYEITVLLIVVNPPRFTQLTRQGGDSDPLKLVQVAIEGAIYKAADGKTHDELSELDLPQAAHKAFAPFPEAMIAGLKITEAHKAILQVDPSLQERAKIVHQATTEKTRLTSSTELEKMGSKSKFEIAIQAEQQEFDLVQIRQAREKSQYLYELEKQGVVKAHELRASLAEEMITQFATRISEDIGAGVSFTEIAEGKKMLDGFMQPSIPQNTIGHANVSPTEIQNVEPSQHNILRPAETQSQISQVSSASSVSKRRRKRIPTWGIEVVEVSLPQAFRMLLDEQEYAFQVCDLSEEAPTSDSYFQETDILIKINNRRVYTLEALESALTSLQPLTKVTVIVLRDQLRVKLILDSSHDADSQ